MTNVKGVIHLHLMTTCSAHSGTTFRNMFYIGLMSFIVLGVLHHKPAPFGFIQIHSTSPWTTNADSKSLFPYLKGNTADCIKYFNFYYSSHRRALNNCCLLIFIIFLVS